MYLENTVSVLVQTDIENKLLYKARFNGCKHIVYLIFSLELLSKISKQKTETTA